MKQIKRLLAILVTGMALFSSMTFADLPQEEHPVLRIAVSFTILQDFVLQITKGRSVEITTIVPVNGDPHTYQPTPRDVKKIAHADLVVVNGLTFEGWIDRLIEASGFQGPIVIAGGTVEPRILCDQGVKTVDPHAWHSVKNALLYVQVITEALVRFDPVHKRLYEKNAAAYQKELKALDQWIRTVYQSIPRDRRKVLTTHDAFSYYGEAYGLDFKSPAGISTEAEPSPKTMVALINLVRDENIRAIFIENMSNDKLVQQIACEALENFTVDQKLFSDSLSEPDGPAATYSALCRYNTKTIVYALKYSLSERVQ